MRIVTEFPHQVSVVEHAWITMSDGCRLAAKLWIPQDAEDHPVPAILEYIPYRKNDATAYRDHSMHAYFAGNGYVSVRVDLRGSGDSDGILADEYLPLEQQDGVEVIAWLAAQPFCSGKVGMIGISWGGFNGLQIAAHAPPELGCVISVCSTDDRYSDDVHYVGGAAMASEGLGWATVMLGYNARPPDPEVVGGDWRRIWLERLEKTPPYIGAWLSHQRRDEFWKQGSVCEDYSAITCPVYLVGGFQDGYRNAIFRFLERHRGPCKGLVGPWGHRYPQEGSPGPAIGFLQEGVRFFDHCLKGVDNGIMDEPKLRVFLQEPMRPTPDSVERGGRWLAEPGWPTPNVRTVRFFPNASRTLETTAGASAELLVPNDETVGVDAGEWCGYGGPLDNPSDQRREDGLSLGFTSEPLGADLVILGFPARAPRAERRPAVREGCRAALSPMAGRGLDPHYAWHAQSDAPGQPRGPCRPRALPSLCRRGGPQRDLLPGAEGSPNPAVGLDGLLAHDVAVTRAGRLDAPCRRVERAHRPGLLGPRRADASPGALRRARARPLSSARRPADH